METADPLTSDAVLPDTGVRSYITTAEKLRECLHSALQLELSAIPPYLCRLYTIRDGSNPEAAALIRSVVLEEMLHMILVANLLNAVSSPFSGEGNKYLFDVKNLIPGIPHLCPVTQPHLGNGFNHGDSFLAGQ